MRLVSFSACTGWYWISSGGKTAMPVAGWVVTETGEVVGMNASNATSVQGTFSTPVLSPPSGIGSYVQEQQLNETARATLKRPSM